MGFAHTAGAALDKPDAGLATISLIRKPDVKGDASMLFSSIYNYAPLIEYESKFSTGASGSVLLNLDGEVIGLTTSVAALPTGEGRAFALPMDGNLIRVVDVLRRGEEVEYGFLGVTRSANRFGAGVRGIPVEHVGPSSPAGLAGLETGEVITHINGVAVFNFEDLLLHVGHGLAGKPVTFTMQRGVQSRDVIVTLAKFKNDVPFIASVKPTPVFGMRVEYGSVLLQMQFNPFFGGRVFTKVPSGVLVRDPLPDSPAEAKLKKLPETARWVVTHVDGRAVLTPAEFYKAAAGKKSVTLSMVDANDNGGLTHEVTLP
jgi:serine protease Do